MKTKLVKTRRALVICLLGIIHLWPDSSATAQIQTGTSLSTPSDYVCVQRGAHSRVWQRAVLQTNQSGVVRTNQQSYTELATGLCYLQNGQYVDSVEQIDAVANGAQATQGRYQVQWAANANTPGGAVTLTTADNKQLLSTVYALTYYDTSTGSNVLLTFVQDCTATIVGARTLIYSNAFSNLTADIRYTYRKAGLRQDIILRQQPPSPAAYGLNPATTFLGVMTEFFNPPAPIITTVTNNGVPENRILNFGDMKMGVGHAFSFNGNTTMAGGTPVVKNWTNIDNRTFLIEEVSYASISNLLSSLQSSTIKPDKSKVRRTVLLEPSKPRKVSAIKAAQPVKVAKATARETGLVLDYDLLSGSNNITFQGDTTYYISDEVDIDRTGIFEGGTVIKYTNTADAKISEADGDGPQYIFNTAPYRPVIFTSANDNTVGSAISESTGTPSTNGLATYLETGGEGLIQGARFSYAGISVSSYGGGANFRDCQFYECGTNLLDLNPSYVDSFENILASHCGAMVQAAGGLTVEFENITVDSCGTFTVEGSIGGGITNSILTAVGGDLTPFTLANTVVAGSGAGIYQTAGAGSYYLADGSIYRNAGTTNIDPVLLADLQTKTTYPPVTNFYGDFTSSYTFFPQAQRDNNGSTVDLGYHYDPIDYAIAMYVNYATLTALPGTALALMGPEYGIWPTGGASLQFQGTATQPINIFRYNNVQEQSNTNWTPTTWEEDMYVGGNPASVNLRFVNWSGLASDPFLSINYTSLNAISMFGCQLYNGTISLKTSSIWATNCLFQRMGLTLDDWSYNFAEYHTFYNNLFWNGSVTLSHDAGDSGGTWTFEDNLFDQSAISLPYSPIEVSDYNGFDTNCDRLSPTGANDIVLTNSPAYETNTTGVYYYPTNLPLTNAGSRLASAAGLYFFTVLTNNVIEGTNQVSIGYHYVACGSNGLPLYTDGIGIPDYIADPSGNGFTNIGGTNWIPPPLLVWITQPASNSKIP
jgi:hypothetical protein